MSLTSLAFIFSHFHSDNNENTTNLTNGRQSVATDFFLEVKGVANKLNNFIYMYLVQNIRFTIWHRMKWFC